MTDPTTPTARERDIEDLAWLVWFARKSRGTARSVAEAAWNQNPDLRRADRPEARVGVYIRTTGLPSGDFPGGGFCGLIEVETAEGKQSVSGHWKWEPHPDGDGTYLFGPFFDRPEPRVADGLTEFRALIGEARANHVRWEHEAEVLEECTRPLCLGAKMLLWPDIEDPRSSPLPAPRPPEPDRTAALVEALRRWLRDDPWVPSAWSGTKVIQWECYACEATITLPPRPLSLTGPDEAWHIDGTGREERCLWLVTREALASLPAPRPPEPCRFTHEYGTCGAHHPCPPEPDRTAALVAAGRAVLTELDIIRRHWDSRPMFVHIDTHTDLRRALAPFVSSTPEPAPVADGTVCDDCGQPRGALIHATRFGPPERHHFITPTPPATPSDSTAAER